MGWKKLMVEIFSMINAIVDKFDFWYLVEKFDQMSVKILF